MLRTVARGTPVFLTNPDLPKWDTKPFAGNVLCVNHHQRTEEHLHWLAVFVIKRSIAGQ